MADNGSSMYLSGTPDSRWNNDDLHNLTKIPASDFEVVKMSPIYKSIPQGTAPVITSFSASSLNVAKGTKVTLTWATTGASYLHLAPFGMVRGTTYSFTANATTTCTLTATGYHGATSASLTVHVN